MSEPKSSHRQWPRRQHPPVRSSNLHPWSAILVRRSKRQRKDGRSCSPSGHRLDAKVTPSRALALQLKSLVSTAEGSSGCVLGMYPPSCNTCVCKNAFVLCLCVRDGSMHAAGSAFIQMHTNYKCHRPIGPSGQKESGTQWRCGTFIWASDWKSGD